MASYNFYVCIALIVIQSFVIASIWRKVISWTMQLVKANNTVLDMVLDIKAELGTFEDRGGVEL